MEVTAGGSANEYGSVEVHEDGTATVSAGTSAHGQGHATSFAMIVADRLGLPDGHPLRPVRHRSRPSRWGHRWLAPLQLGGTAVHAAAAEVLAERGAWRPRNSKRTKPTSC